MVVHTPADLPDVGLGLDYQFEVAPDGSLWSSLWRSADGGEGWLGKDPNPGWEEQMAAVEDGRLVCDGLARFDGESLDRFLPGLCIAMDIAADGSVWVLAGGKPDTDYGADLAVADHYVILPEAVADIGEQQSWEKSDVHGEHHTHDRSIRGHPRRSGRCPVPGDATLKQWLRGPTRGTGRLRGDVRDGRWL